MLSQSFDSIFMDFNLKLHARKHLLCRYLEVLKLLDHTLMGLLLCQAIKLVIKTKVFQASKKFRELLPARAAYNDAVNQV